MISRRSRALLLPVVLLATLVPHTGTRTPPAPDGPVVVDTELPDPAPATGTAALRPQGASAGTTYAGFVALERPVRLLDTRTGTGAPAGAIGPGGTVTVQIAGRSGIPADADAVVMNVTADAPTSGGYLTVYPAGGAVPGTSNLNLVPGRTVANLVVMRLTGGKVSVANAFGATHVLADVLAYTRADGHFVGVAPTRILDTRTGTGAPAAAVGPGGHIDVTVTGKAGIPADPSLVGAVVVNLTADGPTEPSYVTTWPAGRPMPDTSSLNFAGGQTVANLVIATVGAGGAISLGNERGRVHLIADVVGWIPAGAAYVPLTPVRVLDTRTGLGGQQALRDHDTLLVDLRSRLPDPSTVAAVVLNVTAAGPAAGSFLTVYPPDGPVPDTSNLNMVAGENVANAVVVRPTSSGFVAVRNERGRTDVVVDLVGVVPRQNAYDHLADASGSSVHVLYVLGADGVEQPGMVDAIRAQLETAVQWFASETGRTLAFDRTAGQIDVVTWRLPRYSTAQLLRWEDEPGYGPLRQLADDGFGYPDGRRYLVYIGGTSVNGYCGLAYGAYATVYQDSGCGSVLSPVTDPADVGDTVNTAQVALHEVLHSLGAVPACAPHHAAASPFHADDSDKDLMWPVVGTGKHVDVGRDDYYGHHNAGCLDVEDSAYLR